MERIDMRLELDTQTVADLRRRHAELLERDRG